MRFIHTADWHLGQNFHGYSRVEEQQGFLEWLSDCVGEYDPDAILVAGDVFDTLVAPAVAQRMLFDFYARIKSVSPSLRIVLIAGNHDSGVRLESPSELLSGFGIHIIGQVSHSVGGASAVDYSALEVKIPLRDGAQARVFAVPFLRMGDCPTLDAQGKPVESSSEAIAALYQGLTDYITRGGPAEAKGPTICMGHLLATGGRVNSASTLIGNAEGVSADYFPPCHYVALGHLHRWQRIASSRPIYYSGSPLPMSFGEGGYPHGVLLVEIPDDVSTADTSPSEESVRFLPYRGSVQLSAVRGDAAQCRDALLAFPEGEPDSMAPIVSLTLLCQEPQPSLRDDLQHWIEGRYVRLGPVKLEYPNKASNPAGGSGSSHAPDALFGDPLPLPIAKAEYRRRYGVEIPSDLLALFEQAITGVYAQLHNEGELNL